MTNGNEGAIAIHLDSAYKDCMTNEIESVEIPIDGVLDLHTFQPREVKDLVPDYLRLCQDRGIGQIRIIHGKGSGQLCRTVHAILRKNGMVESFRLAGEGAGGWGATIAQLKKSGEKNGAV
jgi:dsDNA-specific endonuclease/ATPase MutS2